MSFLFCMEVDIHNKQLTRQDDSKVQDKILSTIFLESPFFVFTNTLNFHKSQHVPRSL